MTPSPPTGHDINLDPPLTQDDFRRQLDGLHSNYSFETCGVWKGLIVVTIFLTIVLAGYSSVVFINKN